MTYRYRSRVSFTSSDSIQPCSVKLFALVALNETHSLRKDPSLRCIDPNEKMSASVICLCENYGKSSLQTAFLEPYQSTGFHCSSSPPLSPTSPDNFHLPTSRNMMFSIAICGGNRFDKKYKPICYRHPNSDHLPRNIKIENISFVTAAPLGTSSYHPHEAGCSYKRFRHCQTVGLQQYRERQTATTHHFGPCRGSSSRSSTLRRT